MIDYAAAALIVLVAGILVVYRHWLAAIWFRMEDPRTIGLFRIALGSLLLANLISVAPLHEYLYTGEGLLTGEQARERWGEQRFSLLYDFDSIEFVAAYTGVLWVACAAFTLGLATSATKWTTWILFVGLIARNRITLQGDHLYAGYLFLLCLSRCHESFSLDAWIRRRRDPSLPRHRRIPAWPRNLMLLQMVPMLCANGLAKSGEHWRQGNVFYFIVNDSRYQPMPMWEISAIFGTNLFRWMTWVTHAFEVLFPLAIVGLVADLVRRLDPPTPTGPAVWVARMLLLAIGIDILYLATERWDELELPYVLTIAAGLSLCVAPLTLRLARRIPDLARRWLLGRRLWATLLVVFAGMLFFALRIDWFTGVTLCTAMLLFEGEELARAWARLTRRPARPSGPEGREPPPQRRWFVAALSGLHVVATTMILLPHAKPTAPWRKTLERPLTTWVYATVGWQSWKMFANGAPAYDVDLELTLRDAEGSELAIGDGILPVGDSRALDKRQKAHANLRSSNRSRAAHAHWVCRRFTAPSGNGDLTVVFYLVKQRKVGPAELAALGVEDAVAQMEAQRRWHWLDEYECDE
jgi:hypothetical protein